MKLNAAVVAATIIIINKDKLLLSSYGAVLAISEPEFKSRCYWRHQKEHGMVY